MWKQALAATTAALALAVTAPAEAGPLSKGIGPKQLGTSSIFSRFNLAALNPQPLPPRWSFLNSFNAKALNPQPLPPRWSFGSGPIGNLSAKIPVPNSPSRFPPVLPKITTLR